MSTSELTLDGLTRIVAEDAAIRRIQRLQPVGGAGDKIMPARYQGREHSEHAIEHRRIDGVIVPCAVLDSVPSQAKRLGLSLLAAIRCGGLAIPYIAVDFAAFPDLVPAGEVTSLDAPHRLYDAILRDSEDMAGIPFPATALYRALDAATPLDARALFGAGPATLLFGSWNSTGRRGGSGGKFARCLVSEIIAAGLATDATGMPDGVGTIGRIDPLAIRRNVPLAIDDQGDWHIAADGRRRGNVAPAEINHGNIPPHLVAGGVSADHCRHIAVISCAALRRNRLPGHDEPVGWALLAALGLLALLAQDRQGYSLRSRCDLVPEGAAPLEIVRSDGSIATIALDVAAARELAAAAVDAARARGLPWGETPYRLRPQARLAELIRRSRQVDDGAIDDA